MHVTGSPRILIVEDSPEYQQLVAEAVRAEGFDGIVTGSGEEALAEFERRAPDLVVLDVALPGIDGIEVCRRVRTLSDVPVLMLTSRGDEVDRVLGLTMGADDYVVKPFFPRELRARIGVLLRRSRAVTAPVQDEPEAREFGTLSIDPGRREVHVDGAPVELTRTEFDILDALTSARGVLSRAQLMEHVWGPSWFGDEHVVDVHVSKLRKKLGDDARRPTWIETVRGYGFRLVR